MHANGSASQNLKGMRGTERSRIRILLVEDHAILQEGLAALLEIEQDLEIVGQAMNASDALELARTLQPAVLMTDLTLGNESGIGLIARVKEAAPRTHSLVLTAHDEEEYFRASMEAGALGYVLKDAGRAELLQGIRLVATGQQYLSSAMARRVLKGYLKAGTAGAPASPTSVLTSREREVLSKIAAGRSNKVIAGELKISVKTVEKHRANLMHKLGLRNSAEVTMFAIRHGLISARPAPPGI